MKWILPPHWNGACVVFALVVLLTAVSSCPATPLYRDGIALSEPIGMNEGDSAGAMFSPGSPILITFDEFSAPCVFVETQALREEYASMGVHFSGSDGGAILDQCGGFGINARSGTQFLAFNRTISPDVSYVPTDPQTVVFDQLMATVSIYVSGGWEVTEFEISAYGADGVLLGTAGASNETEQWALLSITSSAGIKRVVVEEVGSDFAFVMDDLTATPIPEPATVSLLILGAFGLVRRRS